MNDIQRNEVLNLEIGMQQGCVQLLYAIIKANIKNPSLLAQADRLLEQSTTARERAVEYANKM
jgi:hypothetical protein